MPTRRTLLRTTGIAAIAMTGGCAGRDRVEPGEPVPFEEQRPDLPVEEKIHVLAAGVEAGAEHDLAEVPEFRRTLLEAGIEVESLARVADELTVEYRDPPGGEGVLRGVGVVAGAYASLLADSANVPSRLRATLVDGDGRKFGEYHVEGEWAIEYVNGEFTAEEYGVLVSDTLKTVA